MEYTYVIIIYVIKLQCIIDRIFLHPDAIDIYLILCINNNNGYCLVNFRIKV